MITDGSFLVFAFSLAIWNSNPQKVVKPLWSVNSMAHSIVSLSKHQSVVDVINKYYDESLDAIKYNLRIIKSAIIVKSMVPFLNVIFYFCELSHTISNSISAISLQFTV